MSAPATTSVMLRLYALLAVTMMSAGCELVEGIFKAGLFVGILAVVLVLGLLFWVARLFRG